MLCDDCVMNGRCFGCYEMGYPDDFNEEVSYGDEFAPEFDGDYVTPYNEDEGGCRMNVIDRIEMVKAMEFIARNLNDEEILYDWLTVGVADGDIKYGDLSINRDDMEELDCYVRDDDDFAELMDTFLRIMSQARKSGGLYCDRVVSKQSREEDVE